MTKNLHIVQNPTPGTEILLHQGDTITFALEMEDSREGKGWIRTSLGNGKTAAREIIENTLYNEPFSNNYWQDIPMVKSGPMHWKITLPLTETGCFEAKCYFKPHQKSRNIWPSGKNVTINVNPASSCCNNIIYNAFVRYFGDFKSSPKTENMYREQLISSLDQEGYTVIPPSGTFRHLKQELDFIIDDLGCTVIQLLPIHPCPTTYARMGRFGSPYATLNFTDVDPALAEFDTKATPVEQFCELVDEVHRRGAKLIMDIAVNHTGWASTLHESHPEWILRDKEGGIQTPGAWGVTWADLTRLDFRDKKLWEYLAGIFLLWCRRGADGFRCDAGYMISLETWQFITVSVREQFPDTVFFLEGLGGPVEETRALLTRGNFNWAYSELFQNYNQASVENYLRHAQEFSENNGLLVHFAETHDNNRLAAKSEEWAKMRIALCALSSFNGSYGFANGVEWLASEKIDVHEPASLNWGSDNNLVGFIRLLNTMIKKHSAFDHKATLKFIKQKKGSCITFLRENRTTGKKLIIAICLDRCSASEARWKNDETGIFSSSYHDLITGDKIEIDYNGNTSVLKLSAAQVLCLTPDEEDVFLSLTCNTGLHAQAPVDRQRARAKALEVITFYKGISDISHVDIAHEANLFNKNPREFCRRINTLSGGTGATEWSWPEEINREVMVPHRQFLLIKAPHRFSARIRRGTTILSSETSLRRSENNHFVLFAPLSLKEGKALLDLTLFFPDRVDHISAPLLFLPPKPPESIKRVFTGKEIRGSAYYLLLTNSRGSMVRPNLVWGTLLSKYDALLGANLSPDFPEDRRIMFSRCRIWAIHNDYPRELTANCLETFSIDNNLNGNWQYRVPLGNKKYVRLIMRLSLAPDQNAMMIRLFRETPKEPHSHIPEPLIIVVRPDIEDRNFHTTTTADKELQAEWSLKTVSTEKGFLFSPSGSWSLRMETSQGKFASEEEWTYGVNLPVEASRKLASKNDLFSPGHFTTILNENSAFTLTACVSNHDHGASRRKANEKQGTATGEHMASPARIPTGTLLKKSMKQFITQRGNLKSVIAGYPWFLDWGRDALVFSRALIKAGMIDEAKSILTQFASYEKSGTLPNMIAGAYPANHDTSDAPLFFITACKEIHDSDESSAFLSETCNGRSIREVLFSIVQSIIEETPTGVYMDPESCLVFSPSHFTWMDTNAPACTPRQGYCIEIQALWHNALRFLGQIAPANQKERWLEMAEKVKDSIRTLFFMKEKGYFADCLHGQPGTTALKAERDDALRPNQLFVITLEALTDKNLSVQTVEACEKLLVPGGIRSLADLPVERKLEIFHEGKGINNPSSPYFGTYTGDENRSRKPAYHNGTAWTWLFPLFCEAWFKTFGEKGRDKARSLLSSSFALLEKGCVGHIPEIMDGNYPHRERGCDAQAWGISELFRVWDLLS